MWEVILPILATLLIGGATLWSSLKESERRKEALEDIAMSCGLEAIEAPDSWKLPIESGAGRLWVRLEPRGDKELTTRVVITIPGPPGVYILPDFYSVRIRPEGSFHWGRETEVGDDSFDQAFFIEGPARLVLPLLDAETRRLLLHLNAASRLDVSTNRIEAGMPDENLPKALPLLLDLGRRFAQPLDVPWSLAENAAHDPEAGVRLQNLLLLIREYPEDSRTAEALRTACSDPSPGIRLRAAKELGAEGHGVLLELAESLEQDTVSAEAVSTLDRELPFERASALLDDAWSMDRIQTAAACLEVIGRSGAAAAVDVLTKVITLEWNELAAVAAQALGATGSPAAEPSLVLALQHEQKDLRVAAANALGRVGSIAAVLPLKEAAERSRLDLDLRRTARQAIAEIQARLQGASPGQLSLAGAEAGQLSLAPAEAGRLSFAIDPAGQLSFPPEEAGQLSLSGAEDKPEEI